MVLFEKLREEEESMITRILVWVIRGEILLTEIATLGGKNNQVPK
jgi:hypothetical protein